jgi:type III pantothenate kinase
MIRVQQDDRCRWAETVEVEGCVSEFLLALDVGNTNTVVGLFEDEVLKTDWRLTTHAERTADEVGMWLLQVLEWVGVRPEELAGVAVSSVVPPMDPRLREGIARYLGHQAFFVVPGQVSGMPLLVDAPGELGADRLCDAIAAFEIFGGPCVVLDFGTALTWEVVSARGEYLGGAISPGPAVTADALSSKTAKLPQVAMAPPERVIGKGTVDSIQSGLFYGYLGAVEGVTRRILDELGGATVVATGGLAGAFGEHSELIEHVDPDLTLKGLRLLWLKNRVTP